MKRRNFLIGAGLLPIVVVAGTIAYANGQLELCPIERLKRRNRGMIYAWDANWFKQNETRKLIPVFSMDRSEVSSYTIEGFAAMKGYEIVRGTNVVAMYIPHKWFDKGMRAKVIAPVSVDFTAHYIISHWEDGWEVRKDRFGWA